MTADDRDLAVRQARMGAEVARELLAAKPCPVCGGSECTWGHGVHSARELASQPPPCAWGDHAWHRAVNRLIRIENQRGTGWQRLLAEERGKRDG